jgi:hypothetical protein
MPVILALGRWRQEDLEFKASLSRAARPSLKKKRSSSCCVKERTGTGQEWK